jgi:hypothetical protein
MQDAKMQSGKKSAIEIDSSIWREKIGNRNRLFNLAGRMAKWREGEKMNA